MTIIRRAGSGDPAWRALSRTRRRVSAITTFAVVIGLAGGVQTKQRPMPVPRLEFALIVSRHGVRSPTWTPDRLNGYAAEPWPDWAVPPGNLTPHGRELMKLMGAYYRDRFVSEGLLGAADCGDAARTYFRADNTQRTVETARALAEGLLPACPTDVHSMAAGASDPLFDPIAAGVAVPDPQLSVAAVTGAVGPRLGALVDAHRAAFDELTRVLNGHGQPKVSLFEEPVSLSATASNVTMNGPLALASTLTENLLLEYADRHSPRRCADLLAVAGAGHERSCRAGAVRGPDTRPDARGDPPVAREPARDRRCVRAGVWYGDRWICVSLACIPACPSSGD
jgi:Histidine phosphatase superfamily (branch 2)